METYLRYNRNGGTTKHTIGGTTLTLFGGRKSRVRYGKTARDHANGNANRSAARRAARADWQRNADKNNPFPFPV